MDHYTLENFALENFGRQVSSIYFNLMEMSQNITFSNFCYQHLDPICTYLEHLIEKTVVNTLANAITEVSVKMILMSLKRWLKSHHHVCICHESDYLDKYMHIAIKFACAMTHCSVTKLNYVRLCDEYNTFTHDFLREYLRAVIEKTTNLRELVSLNHPGVLIVTNMKDLLHWSGYITPTDLHNLANFNGELRILKLNNPSISDRSISSILKFLKLIHLDITNTKLTAKGTERLIRGLKASSGNTSKSQRSALTYLAVKVSPHVLKLIPEYLPNLTTLKLHFEKAMDLTLLKGLKKLTSLSLKCPLTVDFACARSLIEQIGFHLNTLNLNMSNINLKFISKYCPALTTFGLQICLLDEEGNLQSLENYRQHIPSEFSSVERLDLIVYGYAIWEFLSHFMSCFMNVKVLKIYCDSESEYENVSINKCLLHPLSEGRLQEIFVNGYRLHLNGRHAIVSDNHGFSIAVMTNDLENVIRELICRRGIFNLRKRMRFIPS